MPHSEISQPQSPAAAPKVYIVDDDHAVRRSMEFLVGAMGHTTVPFASAEEFFDAYQAGQGGCVLLDIQMTGWTGLELQQRLVQAKIEIPIIFISGHADVKIASRAFRAGAVDVLQKPVDGDVLKLRIAQAMAADARRRERDEQLRHVESGIAKLTPREREVLDLLIEGKSIKQIATGLAVSHQTAAKHRARVFEKMEVDNEVELLQLMRGEQPLDSFD